MVIVYTVALLLIFGVLVGYVFLVLTAPTSWVPAHMDTCKICREDMRRGED